ncbi:MAG: hypothetical protein QNJ54_15630 [Prochloraceae cyanobacterium]|nr:hypothetical protein [Prochloraceae cyanobacterium]
MTWRNSTDAIDRIFATLVYLLPLFVALQFGTFIFANFPFLQSILVILVLPVLLIYQLLASLGLGSFIGLIVFLGLFFAVVRNDRISRFIRFNTMQALLIDILLYLCSLVLGFLAQGLGTTSLLIQTIYNIIFLATLAACFYSMFQSARGIYAEIPTISDAASSQIM